MRKRGRRQFSRLLENLGALEMVLRFDVARSPDQNESRFTAPPAWREMLAEQASHFMVLCMDGIMGHPVDSRMRHGVSRLELSANRGHGSISIVWT